MRFLLPSMATAAVLIAISAVGWKAEAAMMPGVGTLPVQTKSYTPVEEVGYRRRHYRRGYYGYGYPYYGYGYRPYGYYGYGYRPYGYYGYGRRWGY
jgi:hypothetical protein